MHEDFIGRGNDVSYDFYRRMFEKENVDLEFPAPTNVTNVFPTKSTGPTMECLTMNLQVAKSA